jgi:hypothetical protein
VARFYEGLDAAAIARRSGLPAGTVRWRLHEGLRRLREGLDRAHAGDRQAWRSVLLPLARSHGDRGSPAPARPSLRAQPGLWALGAATAASGLLAWQLARPSAADRAKAEAIGPEAAANPFGNDKEGKPMRTTMLRRATVLIGSVLPALSAASRAEAALTAEAVSWCVDLREKVFACKDTFADAFVARRRPPPEQELALIGKASEEITEDGSGPLEPRQKKCRQWIADRLGGKSGQWRRASQARLHEEDPRLLRGHGRLQGARRVLDALPVSGRAAAAARA